MRVKRGQYLLGAGAIFCLAGDEYLIAAIGQRHIKRLLNARQMLAMLAIKLGQKSIIVELKNKRFADKALMSGEVFVRTAQARAPIFLKSSKAPLARVSGQMTGLASPGKRHRFDVNGQTETLYSQNTA